MSDNENCSPPNKRTPWNKGKLIGARPPLRPKHVWSIRTKLQVEGRTRDLAMFGPNRPQRISLLWAMYGRRPRCKGNLTFVRSVRVRSCIRPLNAAVWPLALM